MTNEGHHGPAFSAAGRSADDHLGSWKEIAAYLKSGVRTAQRWETLEGLPIHRHVHNKLGTVYAFKSEIDLWRQRRAPLRDSGPPVGHREQATENGELLDAGSSAYSACRLPFISPEPLVDAQKNGASSPFSLHRLSSTLPEPVIEPVTANPSPSSVCLPPPTALEPVMETQGGSGPSQHSIYNLPFLVSRRWVAIGFGAAAIAITVLAAFVIPRAPRPERKPPSERVMLAVLPMVNLTHDPGQDYFSDGLTEEMITALGRMDVARLGVIARTSSMKYKNTTEDVSQIGRELGVNYILEGSVRTAGKETRISVQLIQVSDQTHLWAQNYERHMDDPLALEEDVAQAVAGRIFIALARPAPARANSLRPVDPEAHEDYLKGRYFWNLRNLNGLEKGIEYFNRAAARDPNYALAYAGLSDCYTLLGLEGLPSREVMPKAKAAALKSVELDDSLAPAHTSLGGVKAFYEWDWQGAETEFKRAIALNANYAQAHHWYANLCLLPQRRFGEAIAEMKRALELDPVSPIINTDLAWSYEMAGQPDKALEQYRRTQELDPTFVALTYRLGQFYARRGMYADAVAMLSARWPEVSAHPEYPALIQREFATGGFRKVQERMLEAEEATSSEKDNSEAVAGMQAALGMKDKALATLEAAYRDRDPGLVFLEVDPDLANLRSDSRFQHLARDVGLLH